MHFLLQDTVGLIDSQQELFKTLPFKVIQQIRHEQTIEGDTTE